MEIPLTVDFHRPASKVKLTLYYFSQIHSLGSDMLDPLTAVGLAANIVQFLDFTLKLVTETRDIHHSASGHSAKSASLSAIADDLKSLSEGLLLSSVRGNTSIGSDLRLLADQAKKVAEELHIYRPSEKAPQHLA
jgi:hypothetical protein